MTYVLFKNEFPFQNKNELLREDQITLNLHLYLFFV